MGSTSQMLEVEPLLREVLDGGEEQPGIALLNPSDQSLVITQFHWAQESTAKFGLDPLWNFNGHKAITSTRLDGRSWICSNSSLTNFPSVAEASPTVAPSFVRTKLETRHSHIKKGVLHILRFPKMEVITPNWMVF